jgi:hypothetical protein
MADFKASAEDDIIDGQQSHQRGNENGQHFVNHQLLNASNSSTCQSSSDEPITFSNNSDILPVSSEPDVPVTCEQHTQHTEATSREGDQDCPDMETDASELKKV